jgi:diguanylate cyclase (GGDEF)-like protein
MIAMALGRHRDLLRMVFVARSWGVLVVCAVLAVPTAWDPYSAAASSSYLAGLAIVVMAMWRGSMLLRSDQRRPWVLLAAAATCWLLGDIAQRVWTLGDDSAPGVKDVFWLASYPLLIAAVAAMIRARGLPRTLRRDIGLDVVVVTAAASIGGWRLLIAPSIGSGEPTPDFVIGLLYPLGDVAAFALAVTLLMMPGRRGVAAGLIIACLGLTLPLDFVLTLLPVAAPDFDAARLDSLLLVVNAMLGAAALHPRRAELTDRVSMDGAHAMNRWRIVLLGTSLTTATVIAAVPGAESSVVPGLIASIVVSSTVVVRFFRVVRDREAAEQALSHLAHHDQLTGAANRLLLMQRLSNAVLARGDKGPDLVLVFLDLDGFKKVNDVWGHPAGDRVLRTVAHRLTELVRANDTVARVGGDEFVLLCGDITEQQALLLGHRIRESVGLPIDIGPTRVSIGVSVGLLSVPAAAGSTGPRGLLAADDLLRCADSAMYEAKREGGGVRTGNLVAIIG